MEDHAEADVDARAKLEALNSHANAWRQLDLDDADAITVDIKPRGSHFFDVAEGIVVIGEMPKRPTNLGPDERMPLAKVLRYLDLSAAVERSEAKTRDWSVLRFDGEVLTVCLARTECDLMVVATQLKL